jgi:hypothetical protein
MVGWLLFLGCGGHGGARKQRDKKEEEGDKIHLSRVYS